jgi:hypothetical protein
LSLGNTGSEADFLASFKGDKGETGEQGPKGDTGPIGPQGERGTGINLKVNADDCSEIGDSYIVKDINDPNGEIGHVVILTQLFPEKLFEDGGYIKGERGEQGPAGQDGKDGLTISIKVGETTYEHENGVISLPEDLLRVEEVAKEAVKKTLTEVVLDAGEIS